VAEQPRRKAVQAVVDEAACPSLQARDVARIDRRGVEPDRFLGRERKRRHERKTRQEPCHFEPILAGSGRHLSIFEYHGIKKKNRKYTAVPICAASVRSSVTVCVP